MPPPTSSPPADHQLPPGTLIAERYRVVSTLGEGGMGIVYLAEHVHMRKRFALKVLLPEWTHAPEVVARFEREAVAAGAVTHPNVAAAMDCGRLADGSFFLVLEYVEGRTLRTVIEQGPLPRDRALDIARGIALAVGAAHARGIVHRDLKPENVMLVARDGTTDFVKVLDFGIARVVEPEASAGGQALTRVGTVLGTPDYMAPEQAMGGAVDARADLYALGVILFEMLTGACPFQGGTMTLLRQQMLVPAPPLPPAIASADPATSALVASLLEKAPSARPASATALVAALDALRSPSRSLLKSEGGEPNAPPVTAANAVRDPVSAWRTLDRRHRRILAAAAGIGALALAACIVSFTTTAPAEAARVGPVATAGEIEIPPPPRPGSSARPAPSSSSAVTVMPDSEDGPSVPPPARPPERHASRRTGPGGIYIPPPRTWFR